VQQKKGQVRLRKFMRLVRNKGLRRYRRLQWRLQARRYKGLRYRRKTLFTLSQVNSFRRIRIVSRKGGSRFYLNRRRQRRFHASRLLPSRRYRPYQRSAVPSRYQWNVFRARRNNSRETALTGVSALRALGSVQHIPFGFKNKAGIPLVRAMRRVRKSAILTKPKWSRRFEHHRAKLWDDFTLRWMKRNRMARYWIKGASVWLRDPWISNIVSLAKTRRKQDKYGGELQNIEQQIGEYVADVDAAGVSVPAPLARPEREALSPRPQPADPEVERIKKLKERSITLHPLTKNRLRISTQARKKPIPAMWLANHECRVAVAAAEKEKAMLPKERAERAAEKSKAYWARRKAGKGELREPRDPLKYPANHWLPHALWKDVQRQVRRFEWRESDEAFFRKGFRHAFTLHPRERSKAPWLQPLIYNRSTYSTRLHEFRRHQFPREQKKYKWLQRVRKSLAPCRKMRYFKWRRWPQLRRYNQKLFYSLFSFPDRRAASRHFRKLNKRSTPAISNFIRAQKGLGTRLDVTLMHLGVVPSIYWARIVAPFGLLRVNGSIRYRANDQLHIGDMVTPEWSRIRRFQHYFKPLLNARAIFQRHHQLSTGAYPRSFAYNRGTQTIIYRHAPEEGDLRRSNRLQGNLFRWFKLDSV
jgi:hypothetical protein